MMKKNRYFGAVIILVLLALLSLALRPIFFPLAVTATPGPKGREAVVSLASQAGTSDGIIILGILIFVFIATPIILHFREAKTAR